MAAAQATLEALDPSNSSKNTLKIENTEKRDTLIADEKRYQKKWAEDRVFEADAPSTSDYPLDSISPADLRSKQPKFFGTMAYPYMNGTLHVGHSFTVSKVEFAAGVARMQGKKVLYPQGYHCTGMPIKACADKLAYEIELFGKNFENCPETAITVGDGPENDPPAPTQAQTKTDLTKFSAKKTKAASKAVKLKYQFQIMLALGIPIEEIHKFADSHHWLQFFPPLCKRDLTNFGARIDWRRSFVTTDANPYYDAFVRWQMNRLHDLNKIKFGKRYTVYSPKDKQPCMDHDRSEGEGVGVQEYTAIKLEVKEWPESAKQKISDKLPAGAKVYFVPATLRPETMYGQNCCFVGPNITYGIYKAGEEYFFVSERAARNMSFQGTFPTWGEFPKIVDLQGSDVIGTLVNAPLSVHKEGIRILPMETVKASKGTGVVTCVPSDSPDDYATIKELIKKAEYYGIKREWAELEILPVIKTEKYGDLIAKALVEQMKINSPKDTKLLAEAKEEAYKEGFYRGTMVYGDFKGESVQEAKPKVKAQLIDNGLAFNYAEPDGNVMSRSGDECIAAHLDQWYINYGSAVNGGEQEWYEAVIDWVKTDGVETFSKEAKNMFEQTLNWLSQWACARSFGLGTKLPWDQQFVVESLSDSTIYMSYYTIAHLLHKDIFGKEMGPVQVKPEQMTDEVWDYVFNRTKDIKTDIPKETLDTMQREFSYWYPLDLRCSGTDLVRNHLTFCLYIHAALFPKEHWPRGVRVNGFLLLNGEKMSKSTGNFLTLDDTLKKFGTDATRVALADGGDGLDEANFDESVANAVILKLYELRKWCEEMVKEARTVESPQDYLKVRENERMKNTDVIQRTGAKLFWDELFENEMNGLVQETVDHYNSSGYKAALKSGFYDFTSSRDFYREACRAAGIGMHADLSRLYIKLQALLLCPVAPHWAEYIWLDVLCEKDTIQNAVFPTVPAQNATHTAARDYVRYTTSAITSAEGAQQKKLAKGKATTFDPKKDKRLTVFMARRYPAWQDKCVELVRTHLEGLTVDVKAVSQKLEKSESKRAMPFVNALKRRIEAGEDKEAVFERKLAFEEEDVLREMCAGLRQTVQKCRIVEIVVVEDGGKDGKVVAGTGEGFKNGEERKGLPQAAELAVPGQPTFHFENVE